jgi:cellulose synthase/poly-beta-1,6-N-acetylglucosamine synthase-like glycosyltransferase
MQEFTFLKSKTYLTITLLIIFGTIYFITSFLGLISISFLNNFIYIIPALVVFINFIDLITISLLLYNFIIGLFGFFTQRLKKINNQIVIPETKVFKKFALIICAHNEEKIILNTLEEMEKLDYPINNLIIIVICDNCTDKTYEKVKSINNYKFPLIALNRKNDTQKGKPYAVKFALNFINLKLFRYDAISVADADNIYHPLFFKIMNYHLQQNKDIIQGYLGVKNPYNSFVCSSNMLAYSAGARSFFSAREFLSMSSALGGTGFVISKKALQIIPWNLKSLVEDFEYSVKALIKGYKVRFAIDAITFDEKPIPFKTSLVQRRRWMQGHWYVCIHNFLPLFSQLIKPKKWSLKLTQLDYLIYLISPGRMIIQLWLILSFLFLFPLTKVAPELMPYFQVDSAIKIIVLILPIAQNYLFATLEGFRWYKIIDVIYYYTIYSFSYIPITIRGLIHFSEQSVWKRTEHVVEAKINKLVN